jgi:hypothetical protein
MHYGVSDAYLLTLLEPTGDIGFYLPTDLNVTPFDQAFDARPTPA